MRPTREQIEVSAYHRWQRRGGDHGGSHDDWVAAEKDLAFGLNYRYVARHRFDGPAALLGKAEADAAGLPRRCRFCEHTEPATAFADPPPPALPGVPSLRAWDECEECRATYESALAGAFESFARPLLGPPPCPPHAEIPVAALKELLRFALSVLPPTELHHFGDTVEWVTNPDHAREARLLDGLGCRVYLTPAPVASPFLALARRVDDEAPWPYLLVFLATGRVVFQTHLPLCTRDEDLEGLGPRGPELSMSAGSGTGLRTSACAYLPAAPARRAPRPARPVRPGGEVEGAVLVSASSGGSGYRG